MMDDAGKGQVHSPVAGKTSEVEVLRALKCCLSTTRPLDEGADPEGVKTGAHAASQRAGQRGPKRSRATRVV